MTVIAMTREMGTLGKDVAQGIADTLGLKVIHSELVEHDLAGKLELEESAVHRFLEGGASRLERWRVDKNKLARCTAEEMLELAQQGDVVIRGWGAVSVLRKLPHVLRVRVCAPMSFRERVMMDRLERQEPNVARGEIEKNDAAHSELLRRLFKINWEEPQLYHVVLNTGAVPIDTCVRTIRSLTDDPAFKETESSRVMLTDMLIEHRVRSALSQKFGAHADIDVNVTDGRLVLRGTAGVVGNWRLRDVAEVCRAIVGVKSVENNITESNVLIGGA